MSLDTKYDLIEKYLNNALSAEELAAIEVKLQIDPAFRDEVAAHRMTSDLLKNIVSLDLKQELKKIHVENKNKPTSKFNRFYYLSGIFIVGLILTSVLLFNKNKTKENISNLNVEPVLNKDPISSKSDTIENKKSELDEKGMLNKTYVLQQSNDHDESKSITDLKAYLPSQPIVNNVSIDVRKNTDEITSAINSSKEESKLPNTNTSSTITSATPAKLPCDDIIIKPEYTIDQTTGDITIDNRIIQGNPPFQFSIDGGENFYDHNQFKSEGLNKYLLVVMDQQNCKSEIIEVKIPTSVNYIIYPDKQKYWEISLSRFEGTVVNIKITSAETSEIVYNTSVSITNTYIWEGSDQNNNPLVMGNYIYEITSLKSSLVLSGIITIVR